MACIGCGLCIDACNIDDDAVRPAAGADHLRFDQQSGGARRRAEPTRLRLIRPRTIVYAVVLAIVAGGHGVCALRPARASRSTSCPTASRCIVKLSDGSIRNGYTFKILNMAPRAEDLPAGDRRADRRRDDGQRLPGPAGALCRTAGRPRSGRHLPGVRARAAGRPEGQVYRLPLLPDRSCGRATCSTIPPCSTHPDPDARWRGRRDRRLVVSLDLRRLHAGGGRRQSRAGDLRHRHLSRPGNRPATIARDSPTIPTSRPRGFRRNAAGGWTCRSRPKRNRPQRNGEAGCAWRSPTTTAIRCAGLTVEAVLTRPTREGYDFSVPLSAEGGGVYSAVIGVSVTGPVGRQGSSPAKTISIFRKRRRLVDPLSTPC